MMILVGPRAAHADVETQAATEHPSARIYGSRLGLVGGMTANGHVILEHDRFVALPSSRALSSRDGHEYVVQLTYRGRTVVAPVWDVGPWNQTDDFWAEERTGAPDLPRFMPEAQAAYTSGYNGGRSLNGRVVTAPVSIDIADGLFEDLGMAQSDWLEVSFLWLTS
ncbi:MAG: hypothetical protein QOF51_2260 [Chloroflexota bacterium]|jgi:hypothetical protein|nr:hypothetical protein [Chloroflexota bacterium]